MKHRLSLVVLIAGSACALLLAARARAPASSDAASADPDAIERGRRLYHEGRRDDDRPIEAIAHGDVLLSGIDAACVRCHQRSGFGTSEGPVRAPSIVRTALVADGDVSLGVWQRAAPALEHPGNAFFEARISAAVLDGRGRDGARLDRSMPRYRIDPSESNDLAAYLATLDGAVSPGVTPTELRLATVVSDAVPPPERDAFIATLQAYVAAKNAGSRLEERRASHAPWPERNQYKAYRKWSLEIWMLEGSADRWQDQVREKYEQNPPFSIVSGLLRDSFEPIAAFCEAHAVPCLFPITPLPGRTDPGFYTFHFSPGMHLDAEVIAAELLARAPRVADVLQIYEAAPASVAAVTALRGALERRLRGAALPGPRLAERRWDEVAPSTAPLPVSFDRPTAVVAWLGSQALARALASSIPDGEETTWFLTTRLSDQEMRWFIDQCRGRHCRVIEPHDARAEAADLRRFGAWARMRGLAVTYPRVQLEAYFALLQLGDALMHVRQHLVREYVVETIEHTAYRSLVTAALPRLQLASGQRFASKGAHVVPISGQTASEATWVVP